MEWSSARVGELDDLLAGVFGMAVAAAADRDAAQRVCLSVLTSAPVAIDAATRCRLEDEAIRHAVRTDPAPAFAGMSAEDAEAVALARLAARTVPEIAARLATDERTVRRRLLHGLRHAADECAPTGGRYEPAA